MYSGSLRGRQAAAASKSAGSSKRQGILALAASEYCARRRCPAVRQRCAGFLSSVWLAQHALLRCDRVVTGRHFSSSISSRFGRDFAHYLFHRRYFLPHFAVALITGAIIGIRQEWSFTAHLCVPAPALFCSIETERSCCPAALRQRAAFGHCRGPDDPPRIFLHHRQYLQRSPPAARADRSFPLAADDAPHRSSPPPLPRTGRTRRPRSTTPRRTTRRLCTSSPRPCRSTASSSTKPPAEQGSSGRTVGHRRRTPGRSTGRPGRRTTTRRPRGWCAGRKGPRGAACCARARRIPIARLSVLCCYG